MKLFKCTICYRLRNEDEVVVRKVPPFITCTTCEAKRMKMRSMTPEQREAERAKNGQEIKKRSYTRLARAKQSGVATLECLYIAILLIFFVMIAAPFVVKFIGFEQMYSAGDRTGVVVKLSKTGYIWKTWEGEMNLGGVSNNRANSAVPTVWRFSVPNDDLAMQGLELVVSGEKSTVAYTEVWKAPFWHGDTDFMITSFRVSDEPNN